MIKSLDDLKVYNQSYDLALRINKEILKLPRFEKYVLCDQMMRASRSVPANIAEGYAKKRSALEFKKFLTSALGSANEMIVHLRFAKDLDYLLSKFCNEAIEEYNIISKSLVNLIRNWKTY